MKIYSSKYEEARRLYDEQMKKYKKYEEAYALCEERYYADLENLYTGVIEDIRNFINSYGFIVDKDYEVSVNPYDGSLTVRFEFGDAPLRWRYKAYFNREKVLKRETSSWTGINATTKEDIEYLRKTLDIIEFLNDYDLETALSVERPSYKDYFDDSVKYASRPSDSDLKYAYMSDLIGTDTWLYAELDSKDFYGIKYLVKFLSETPKRYNLEIKATYGYDGVSDWSQNIQISKNKLNPISKQPDNRGQFENWTDNPNNFILTDPENFEECLEKLTEEHN